MGESRKKVLCMKLVGGYRDKQPKRMTTGDRGGDKTEMREEGKIVSSRDKRIKSEEVGDNTSMVEAMERENGKTGRIGKVSASMDPICEKALDAFDLIDIERRRGGPNRGGIFKKRADIGSKKFDH